MKTLATVETVRETLLLQRGQSYRLGGDCPQINAKSIYRGFFVASASHEDVEQVLVLLLSAQWFRTSLLSVRIQGIIYLVIFIISTFKLSAPFSIY